MKNIIISGVGGQGTVSIGHILSEACLEEDIDFISSETHGMSQRGGSVIFHLRIGKSQVAPVIGKGDADIILAGEPMEALRVIEYLKPKGHVITSEYGILSPVANQLGMKYPDIEDIFEEIRDWPASIRAIDTNKIAKEIGNTKVTNIILLGYLLSTDNFPISYEKIQSMVEEKWPKFAKYNLEALERGYNLDKQKIVS